MSKQDTNISATLKAQQDGKQMYDKHVKAWLADKQVLARILKYTVEEFFDCSLGEIMAAIDGKSIHVSSYHLEPTEDGAVKLEANEDWQAGAGFIFYDIRFRAVLPDAELEILINIEAQRTTKPGNLGYHLENRVVYYLARMISGQKGKEFTGEDYDKIKKVRSIWICLDDTVDECIEEFRFVRSMIYGKKSNISTPDLMRGIIVHLRQREDFSESPNPLIAVLEDVISRQGKLEKLRRLKETHGFVIDVDVERRIGDMCNWSDAIEEYAEKRGEKRGEERADKRVAEIMAGIARMIKAGNSDEEIIEVLKCPMDKVILMRSAMGM